MFRAASILFSLLLVILTAHADPGVTRLSTHAFAPTHSFPLKTFVRNLSWSGALQESTIRIQLERTAQGHHFRGVIDSPVEGRLLRRILAQSAPGGDISVGATLADWRMPDDPDETRLQAIHRPEGPKWAPFRAAWATFMRSRHQYMRVLQAPVLVPDNISALNGRCVPYARDIVDLLPTDGLSIRLKHKDTDRLAAVARWFEQLDNETYRAAYQGWITQQRSHPSSDKTANRVRKLDPAEQIQVQQWNSGMLRGFLTFLMPRIIESRKSSFTPRGSSGNEIPRRSRSEHRDEEIALHNFGIKRFRHPTSNEPIYVQRIFENDFSTVMSHELNRNAASSQPVQIADLDDRFQVSVNAPPLETMLPYLAWNKNAATGQRTWDYRRSQPDIAQNAENALLGAIVITSLAECKRGWPNTMSLPGGEYKQNMTSAQVPVLVPLMERRWINNVRLLQEIEERVLAQPL